MNADQLETFLRERLHLKDVKRSNFNIMACCPAHADSNPSWGMSIEPPHLHGCFSCGFRGSLFSMLVFKYKWTPSAARAVTGDPLSWHAGKTLSFVRDVEPVHADNESFPSEEELWPFKLGGAGLRYMLNRGFKRATLEKAGVLYHQFDRRVLFPWYVGKVFRGATGRAIDPTNKVRIAAYFGLSKKSLCYMPSQQLESPLVLVEGEIDALAVMQAGYSVIALGRGSCSALQLKAASTLRVKSSQVILAFDNDATGLRLTHDAGRILRGEFGLMDVRSVQWPRNDIKCDPASFDSSTLVRILRAARPVSPWRLAKVCA